jgi:hypothetical protein
MNIPLLVLDNVGAQPVIEVRVGNGPKVPVLLDTGSIGLHIYSQGVRTGARSGVSVSSQPTSVTYFDGSVQSGVIARARLTIGRLTTTRPVSFGLIKNLHCVSYIPHCPAAAGIAASVHSGEFGIMGIGLRRFHGLGNPLLALRAPYSERWSIHLSGGRGVLALGAPIPAHPVASFRMARDGTDPSGAPAWNDARTKVCWGSMALRGASCVPTVFDTGSVTMLWYGGLLARSSKVPWSILVNPGTYIAAWEQGHPQPFWTFTAGTYLSHNTVLAFGRGKPLVIGAVQSFFTFSITFDDTSGEIVLSHG